MESASLPSLNMFLSCKCFADKNVFRFVWIWEQRCVSEITVSVSVAQTRKSSTTHNCTPKKRKNTQIASFQALHVQRLARTVRRKKLSLPYCGVYIFRSGPEACPSDPLEHNTLNFANVGSTLAVGMFWLHLCARPCTF